MNKSKIIILLIVIASVTKQSFGQSDSLSKIVKADTIYFSLIHSGCFGGYDENIIITIISKDSCKVDYKNNREAYKQSGIIAKQLTISSIDFYNFITIFKSEMNKQQYCMSTSNTKFVLKSKYGKIGFENECSDFIVNGKKPPNLILKEALMIK